MVTTTACASRQVESKELPLEKQTTEDFIQDDEANTDSKANPTNNPQTSKSKEELVENEKNKSKTDTSQQTELEDKKTSYYKEQYKDFLYHFFLMFSDEFQSPSELNQETILFFTQIETMQQYNDSEIPYELDNEMGVYFIPSAVIQKNVEHYFGLVNFSLENSTQYTSEKDAYMYPEAHGFPIVYPQIEAVEIDNKKITYTVIYTNPELENNPILKTLKFCFTEINEDGQSFLQAISAYIVEDRTKTHEVSDTETEEQPDTDIQEKNTSWKTVNIQMPVQTQQSGLIDGEYLDISILVPETWKLASNNVFTENGETKSAGYFATLFKDTSPTLSTINPEDAMGYISHQTVELNNKTQALLIITAVFMGKENIPIPTERIYAYNYDIIHDNYILSIIFHEKGFDNKEGIEFHKKILDSIQYN